jgi:hypothetical protein
MPVNFDPKQLFPSPSPPPARPPAPQPSAPQPPGGGEAFGFAQAPKEEKYDTLYLVSNMLRERRRRQLTVLAVLVAAILGIILWVAIRPEPKEPAIRPGISPAAEEQYNRKSEALPTPTPTAPVAPAVVAPAPPAPAAPTRTP